MHIFFQNNQYLGSYYFTRSADDPVDARYYMFQALLLFPGPNCNIVVGSILLAESFAFMCLGLMNKVK